MFDKSGQKTMDPHEATRFLATVPSQDSEIKNFRILVSVHDEDSSSHLDLKTPAIKNDADFETLVKLKNSLQTNLGDNEGLSVNWYKFSHDINVADDSIYNIQESKDISKPFGSTKSSYQMIGNSKLIIRHTDPVNEEKLGSRWRHIRNIFIETKLGERFVYPHTHIAGARAMARHLSSGGSFNDRTSQAILKMSEDYINLKKANKMMRNKDNELSFHVKGALDSLGKDSKRMSGSKGYAKGIHQLANKKVLIDASEVVELRNQLANICAVESTDVDNLSILETAARYILMNREPIVDASDNIARLERLAGLGAGL